MTVLDVVSEVTRINVNEILDQPIVWTLNWLGYSIDKHKKQQAEIDKAMGRTRI